MLKLDSDVILSKKVLIPTGIVLGVIIIMMIIASIFGGKKTTAEYIFQLNARTTNLSKTLQAYNKSLTSSQLTSPAAALNNNLTAITSFLTTYIQSDEYKDLSKSITEDITASEKDVSTALNDILEQARLNANLDKVYAQQMATQISDIVSIETSARDTTDDDTLKASLEKSISNLNALYNNFSSF